MWCNVCPYTYIREKRSLRRVLQSVATRVATFGKGQTNTQSRPVTTVICTLYIFIWLPFSLFAVYSDGRTDWARLASSSVTITLPFRSGRITPVNPPPTSPSYITGRQLESPFTPFNVLELTAYVYAYLRTYRICTFVSADRHFHVLVQMKRRAWWANYEPALGKRVKQLYHILHN